MSRTLSELLGAAEPAFTQTLQELERVSGSPSADVKLLSELNQKAASKLKELGLDPKDTNGLELYESLQDLVAKHDEFLSKAIGVSGSDTINDILPKIKKSVEKLSTPKTCWAIKHSVIRKLLRQNPPKKVMSQLRYRSVDSMLKREQASELLGAARIFESKSWMQKFVKNYRNLKPSDFEIRKIEITILSTKRYKGATDSYVLKHHKNMTHLKELGAIFILPMPIDQLQGATIALMAFLLYYVNELRFYSSYLKFNQVKPDFPHILVETVLNDAPEAVTLHTQPVHWKTIQRYINKVGESRTQDIFEPYIQFEDFEWRSAEQLLYKIEPALKFWDGMDFIGLPAGQLPIPLGLLDNVIDYMNNLSYGSQSVEHFRSSLWSELWTRYIGQQNLEQQVLEQLDNSTKFAAKFENMGSFAL